MVQIPESAYFPEQKRCTLLTRYRHEILTTGRIHTDNRGVIAGIVVAVAVVVFIVLIIYMYYQMRRTDKRPIRDLEVRHDTVNDHQS